MHRPEPVSAAVERHIEAPAELIYDLVSDVTRMGEWSPETIDAGWIGGATGPVAGARFRGRNRLGFASWTTKPVVTAAERGRLFAFRVPGRSGATWRYELHPTSAGTRVVETVSQERPSPLPIRLLQRCAGVTDRSANLAEGMARTLERLAAAATAHPRVAAAR